MLISTFAIWDDRPEVQGENDFTPRQKADIATFWQIMVFLMFVVFTLSAIVSGVYAQFNTPPTKRTEFK